MNKIYKDMYTTENIEAIGGIDNMNRWVKEMQKNDMRIKRNKFLDSVFTLVLDAALIYGIVILTMRIFYKDSVERLLMMNSSIKEEQKNMIRSIETFCVDGEKFIDYYSENDFEYTVHVGQKCKVLKNGKYFAGTLCDVNPDESTFSIKLSNEEIMEISCGDIEEFLGEEELEISGGNNMKIEETELLKRKNLKES